MFEQIAEPKSQPVEMRTFRIRFGLGALLFGLGALLPLAHDYVSSPLFGHVRGVVFLLMTAGIALEFWGASTRYHDSGTNVR